MGNAPADKPDEHDLLTYMPKNIKNKAAQLIEYIKRTPVLSWNDRLNLIYKGRIIPGSNIVDLIRAASYKYKDFNPPGQDEFHRALREQNVPETLLRSRAVPDSLVGNVTNNIISNNIIRGEG